MIENQKLGCFRASDGIRRASERWKSTLKRFCSNHYIIDSATTHICDLKCGVQVRAEKWFFESFNEFLT